MTPGRSSTAPTIASAYSDHPAEASFVGSETATTSWPRASSSPDTRCQYQASPPAPGISTYVVFGMRAPLTRVGPRRDTRLIAAELLPRRAGQTLRSHPLVRSPAAA